MLLSQEEMAVLTGKQRPKAQARALEQMGIPFRLRPDGMPVVLRTHIEIADRPSSGRLTGIQPEPVLQA